MSKINANMIWAASALALVSPVLAEDVVADVTLTTAGTYDFQPSANPHGALVNQVASGGVTLTSADQRISAENAITFTKFDAVEQAQTCFSGGWWDFGKTADTHVNFFTNTATASSRMTTLANGATIADVGTAWIAGSSGTDNALTLSGGSSFSAASLVLGSKGSGQRTMVTIKEGSSLTCSGVLCMSRFQVSTATGGRNKTGNALTVTGTDSSLTVNGTTSVGGAQSDVFGSAGGNTLTVTEGARANLQRVNVATAARHGQCNKIVFGRNAAVTMNGLYISYDGASSYASASNTIEIVDGAVVNNTGAFVFGGSNASCGDNELLISNASFTTQKAYVLNNVNYVMVGPNSVFRLSGSNARFVSTTSIDAFFKGNGCTFIVENDADYSFPSHGLSYTVPVQDETIIVRSGATLRVPSSFRPTKSNTQSDLTSKNNAIIVEDDAQLIANGLLVINGLENRLVVSNATVMADGNAFGIGGIASSYSAQNCLLQIAGSRPVLQASWYFHVQNTSTLRIDLPSGGYETGYATSTRPIIQSLIQGFNLDDTSTIEIRGAQKMLDAHIDQNKTGEYVLIGVSSSHGISLPTGTLDALQAKLPKGMTLSVRTKSGRRELVLTVKPDRGMMLFSF